MTNAYPLHWPIRQARTPSSRRGTDRFGRELTISVASYDLQEEVRRLGGRDLVISTNVRQRVDGTGPLSGQRAPDDAGVAVYFTRAKQQVVFACDRYRRVEANLRAIALHLDAMRGMDRWGVGTLDQAFAGFQALPETAGGDPWWKVLGAEDPIRTGDELQAAYREAARRAHPDKGGSQEAFVRVQRAFEQGREALGGAA
jgi:hypothetical protein